MFLSNQNMSRRDLFNQLGIATLALPGLSSLVSLPAHGGSLSSLQEAALLHHPKAMGAERKLGVALVGLGKYSHGQLGPALEKTKLCQLTGIVTGTPEKAERWKKKYNIPDRNVYNYQTFDQIADNPAIDIIYIVLPNPLHAEYSIRAAQAGKHVICEKPMAMNPAECQQMIDACNKAQRKLSIGYRLHFEPHNLEMMRLGQNEVFGKVNGMKAENGQMQGYDTPWRLGGGIGGGGPLRDVGIYCIQGAIYTKGEIPVAVTANYHPITEPKKFDKVEEGVDFQLHFGDGSVAECKTSYNDRYNLLRAEAARGWFELSPAYAYNGIRGETSRGKMNIDNVPQQTRQMDAFADCILNNKPTSVPGEMGMRDVEIIQAVFRAADTGSRVPTREVVQVLDSVKR
jgi:predicted dehydrogenase